MVDAVALAIGAQTSQERVDTAALVAAISTLNATLLANAALLGGQATPTLPGTLTSIDANLNWIVYHLGRIADNSKAISSGLQNLEVAAAAQVSAMNDASAYQALAVAAQIDAIDFQRSVTEQALTSSGQDIPKLAPFEERIKTKLKSAADIASIAKIQGFITQQMQNSLKSVVTYTQGTQIYKTVAAKVESITQAITAPEIPSPSTLLAQGKSLLGIKATDISGLG